MKLDSYYRYMMKKSNKEDEIVLDYEKKNKKGGRFHASKISDIK